MADNTQLNSGSGGDVIAADDISGVKFQRIKLVHGADGVNAGDVSSANPLPVTNATGATSANQDTGNASLAAIDGKLPALGQALAAASVPVVLTAAQVTTLTPPAAITGFATESTLSSLNGKVTAVNTGAVVVSSSALPTGAATAAKQPALGTAGTASADVLTVQGVASMIALKVDGSAVTQPVSGTVTANAGSGTMAVSLASVPSHAVTNAGTFAVQAASAGDVAHDGADSGNPVKVGGKATSAEPTAVSSGDRTNFITDLVGKLITLPYSNPENFVSGAITSAMTGTTSTSLIAAPGAGLRNYITTIIVSNAHATVGTDVAIQDGSGGTTLLTIPAAAVYGGAVINLPVPLRQPTTNTALYCANVTTGASTKVSAAGYKGA